MSIRRPARVLLLVAACVTGLNGQERSLRTDVETWVSSHQRDIVGEFVDLLSIPNIAANQPAIERNVATIRQMLERRGFKTEALATDGNPLVYGERRQPGSTRTVLFYIHYDGQPVDPKTWAQASPFVPVLRDNRIDRGGREIPDFRTRDRFEADWRLFARSASDDKAPIMAFCAALDALKASGRVPSANIRVVMDGDEESGSAGLVPAIARYRDKLAADVMIILDGPVHDSGRPTVGFGARGILALELTVFGPKVALHSGHYGNWVPNPAFELVRLLASMKDTRGHVLVPGFYDGLDPLSPEEQAMLDAVPEDAAALKARFGIAQTEQLGLSLQAAVQRPSLNIRGLSSASVGISARTIIPDRAVAAIDIRLVKETPSAAMLARLEEHIAAQGFHVVHDAPDDATRAAHPRIVQIAVEPGGVNAYRTSPLAPESRRVVAALSRMFGEPPVQIRTSGGTVPIAPFIDAMGFPAVSVPIVNPDNNQHAENENVRLGHLFSGIATLAAILTM
jgi:acetylornithine deacetylase/succinyl-diaminopimelate desuccinylase-like protein